MDATYLSLVLFGLVVRGYSDNITEITSTSSSTEASTISETTTEIVVIEPLGTRGLYGGSYYNSNARNPQNNHYVHGVYQPPQKDYYKRRDYFRDDGSDETLDYYLGFGLSKMTDQDFQYDDFHHYYHDINRTIAENETIPSDFVVGCHPNATFLCPENTETVCLMNGTIFCMSTISAVVPCPQNETTACVATVVPCVRACVEVSYNFEEIFIPCLSTVVIVDVYEDNKGKTLGQVSGTFVIMDALKETERTFCVAVIVDPKPKQTD
ncbi:hypothetical protein Zmor_009496 [Zophobas morio]|uniref:Uncharacterized protein n=1 Tax=Zophobas morio TaxID=2755281 RepID=A0AA38MIE4_9CUCU|nr:hypothetical protein Zmor_009496 [Zophobas morio]